MRRAVQGRWSAKATVAAAGSLLLTTAAMLAGAPLWAAATLALLGIALTLTVLAHAGRRVPAALTRARADDLVARDAVLHRLRPLTPHPPATQFADAPRPMLWERPRSRPRRVG